MNTKIKPDIELLRDKPEFIQGFDGNPFARVACRSIPNKICSGSCGDCKKEREVFQKYKISELQRRNTNGDPDYDDIYGTPEEVWDTWISRINQEKERIKNTRNNTRLIEQASRESIISTLQ